MLNCIHITQLFLSQSCLDDASANKVMYIYITICLAAPLCISRSLSVSPRQVNIRGVTISKSNKLICLILTNSLHIHSTYSIIVYKLVFDQHSSANGERSLALRNGFMENMVELSRYCRQDCGDEVLVNIIRSTLTLPSPLWPPIWARESYDRNKNIQLGGLITENGAKFRTVFVLVLVAECVRYLPDYLWGWISQASSLGGEMATSFVLNECATCHIIFWTTHEYKMCSCAKDCHRWMAAPFLNGFQRAVKRFVIPHHSSTARWRVRFTLLFYYKLVPLKSI